MDRLANNLSAISVMEKSPEIFICYRESDTAGYAELLYAGLTQEFGPEHVFLDTRSIHDDEWLTNVKAAIASAKIFLPLIGSNWESLASQNQEANNPDSVYLEIREALQHLKESKDLKIRPVLIGTTSMPQGKNLPDDIKKLTMFPACRISREAREDGIKTLISVVKRDLRNPILRYEGGAVTSIVLGSVAAALASLFLGLAYLKANANSEWWRVIVSGLLGLLAGLALSVAINLGMKLGRQRWLTTSVGAIAGGAMGGVLAIAIVGMPFFVATANSGDFQQLADSEPVHPILIIGAVVVSSCCMSLGLISPRQRSDWLNAGLSLIVVVCGVLVMLILLIKQQMPYLQSLEPLRLDSSTSTGVIVFGSVLGAMAGLQVIAMLKVFEMIPRVRDLFDPSSSKVEIKQ